VASTERVRSARRPNDPGQYDDLAERWWDPRGPFAMLQWIAAARAALVPPASRPGAVLADLGCGAGLLAPHVAGKGYRHVGVDLTASALVQACAHGVAPVQGDVLAVPLADGCADVVCAGEILEHVPDLAGAVAQACRLLRPGGLLVLDTLAATALGRFLGITIAERLPGGPPPGIHDPALFVDRARLLAAADALGLDLRLVGLRPSVREALAWKLGRRDVVRMKPVRSTAVVFAGYGRRREEDGRSGAGDPTPVRSGP
jgi:2-polyprenyl-6-hydroxyphenyl methylase / 3-demethylubiquinone-9 3-methyltransferase